MSVFVSFEPALIACAALLGGYTMHLAFECVHADRSATGTSSAEQAVGSRSLVFALGTGLWAVVAIASMMHGTVTADLLEWPWVAGSWAAAIVAALGLWRGSRRWSEDRMAATGWLAASALGLIASAWAAEASKCRIDLSTMAGAAIGLHTGAPLAASGALALPLVAAWRGPEASRWTRFAWVGLACALLLAQGMVSHLIDDGEPVAHASSGQQALITALVAAVLAVIVLTMTRLTMRIERRLTERAAALSNSLQVANENLQKLAYRDPLTGLSNRLMFDRRLKSAVTQADQERGRLTLLYIDLDGFKPINDGYGHTIGDRVLREIGVRLRRSADKGATIARIGGDEFVMLVRRSLNTGEASELATQVLGSMRTPFTVKGIELGLSCSIGIAYYPDCGAGDKLLAAGDAAMYIAKKSGGSSFAFHEPEHRADSRDQAELMRDLRKAVEGGQFELVYQPKIKASTGQVSSVEALLRWNHPARGLVSPDVFIPLAERIGLIGRIGDWVLDEACRQMAEWRAQGLRMRVSVNLSAQQLRQPGLVQRIESLLKTHAVDASQLTCEITESAAMADTGNAHRTLMRLGRIGVRVSIDDFGTGHSSLAYLRQLPATELKIDRSFVQDVASSSDARAIVQAVVQLAHALDLRVVAEGVETKEQRNKLLELGCDEFQGFLFAKPLPAEKVLQWGLAERAAPRTFSNSLFLKGDFSAAA